MTGIPLRIAILGGGPSGLFVTKRLVKSGRADITIDIFEAGGRLGPGMPYGPDGANTEHIANVSSDEIPELITPVMDWLSAQPEAVLKRFAIDMHHFSEHRVLPRLLFGDYLEDQFQLLLTRAKAAGIAVNLHLHTKVHDLSDDGSSITVTTDAGAKDAFDHVVICTGHNWPTPHEDTAAGYFDSPYPPAKLAMRCNHPVAVRGSSLTAIDAIRTLARGNGRFVQEGGHVTRYIPSEDSPNFKIVMHSRDGLLPCVRFHFDNPHEADLMLSERQLQDNMRDNDGFVSLDFVFEQKFKQPLREKDPAFHAQIAAMDIETFVAAMLDMRTHTDPFVYLASEYGEAHISIRRERPVYWKEALSVLSFILNYPAKHFSAEDMLRLQRVLKPLISIVIAFMPQGSCEELLALHDAGRVAMVAVGSGSEVKPQAEGGIVYHYADNAGERRHARYATFVDCIGQPPLPPDRFPFPALVRDGTVAQAKVRFRSSEHARAAKDQTGIFEAGDGRHYLTVQGLAISDAFEAVGADGVANSRLFIMAVPYIGGFNPDYSGLDFCEEASLRIAQRILDAE